jgi:hypothetical protein
MDEVKKVKVTNRVSKLSGEDRTQIYFGCSEIFTALNNQLNSYMERL